MSSSSFLFDVALTQSEIENFPIQGILAVAFVVGIGVNAAIVVAAGAFAASKGDDDDGGGKGSRAGGGGGTGNNATRTKNNNDDIAWEGSMDEDYADAGVRLLAKSRTFGVAVVRESGGEGREGEVD